jgi:hypothetical protein
MNVPLLPVVNDCSYCLGFGHLYIQAICMLVELNISHVFQLPTPINLQCAGPKGIRKAASISLCKKFVNFV